MSVYDDIARDTIAIGGGTWARDDYKHVILPNRYTVALGAPWSRVIEARSSTFDWAHWDLTESLTEFANATEPWQASSPFATEHNPKALGTWVDPKTGNIHVDIVESYVHGGYALRLARERGQIAIFDQWTWKSIDVPTDNESVA